ncbi:hypothetical protein GOODEAATRI_009761 [Goodea atripinnis]|uniref:Uncharacterized protein n=1 Tax=Goodea atripinnis TaxID=208336 RepID=A0ABV0MQU1_9TELE
MKALERLTSTVQNELAAALARKTRKALSEQDSETTEMSRQESSTPSEESSPLGGMCALRDGNGSGSGGGMGTVCGREELTSRLGLEAVQRLAKDGCRLLQNHNYRLPDRNQAPDFPLRRSVFLRSVADQPVVCLKPSSGNTFVLCLVSFLLFAKMQK